MYEVQPMRIMKKNVWFIFVLMIILALLTACNPETAPGRTEGSDDFLNQSLGSCVSGYAGQLTNANTKPQQLTVMTHDSFSVSRDLIIAFETANNATITFIKSGDTGSALNRLILTSATSEQPEADVFYGIDNTFLSRALDHQLFDPYQPATLKKIPEVFKLDQHFNVVPINYADVCINYDKAWFDEHDLPIPQTLNDLINPIYKGLLVIENPATSSPGLCFLMATIAELKEDTARDFWISLKENDVVIASDWETAYYTHFSGSSGKGHCPMVVSYATSPAAEWIYAETQLDESPTGSIVEPGMVWRQIECAGILKNTPNRALAELFIDFLLSKAFQEDIPLQMFVYPVLPEAALPPEFELLTQAHDSYNTMNPSEIAENRDRWVNDWTEWMLD